MEKISSMHKDIHYIYKWVNLITQILILQSQYIFESIDKTGHFPGKWKHKSFVVEIEHKMTSFHKLKIFPYPYKSKRLFQYLILKAIW